MLIPTIIVGILVIALVWQSWNSGTTNDNNDRGKKEIRGLDYTFKGL